MKGGLLAQGVLQCLGAADAGLARLPVHPRGNADGFTQASGTCGKPLQWNYSEITVEFQWNTVEIQ